MAFTYLTSLDDEYRPRNMQLRFVPNGHVFISWIFKDDSPGCQNRNNPDIPWSVDALNIEDQEYWSMLKRQISGEFSQFLRQTGIRKN